MAAGRPVIAYGRGGALDSVIPGVTGMFFDEQTAEAVETAVREFEDGLAREINPAHLVAHAAGFSSAVFADRMRAAIATAQANKAAAFARNPA